MRPRRPPVDFDTVIAALIRCRFNRDLLLSWIPDDVIAALPVRSTPAEQYRSDVMMLAQHRGHLMKYLRNAERMAGPFAGGKIFAAAIAQLGET